MFHIRGGGGGSSKSGSSGGIQEDPNSLSSIAYVQLVEAISEGEIVGLVNGEFSIYLDGVPLRDTVGTPNYRPFQWGSRNGLQDQDVINGFGGTQQLTDVSVKITLSGGAIIRPIPDPSADAVRVTMTFPALTATTPQGEVQGTTVQYQISIRKVGGTWMSGGVQTVTGKSSGQYQVTAELDLTPLAPSPSGYEVSVSRITADSTSSLTQNDTYWSDYVIVNYEKFTYPNTALMALQLDSRYFSQVPARTYHVRGRIIAVPKNYDTVSRTYATTGDGTTNGAWDGTFKLAYSNNPAWCYYDMLASTRYGLGKRLNFTNTGNGPMSPYVDRFALYVIGQYCDELVPTGIGTNIVGDQVAGGFDMSGKAYAPITYAQQPVEPRFSLNICINTQQDAYRLLTQLSTAFRGMSYWAQSQAVATQDSPGDVEYILNNSNVKDSKFIYQGSSRAQRHTVVTVGWNDPVENFRQKWEYVQDLEAVKKWGVRQTSMVVFGCTSQGQARRAGLWLLYTERAETEAVQCAAGMDMAYVLPGMIGEINDYHKAGIRWGGRTQTGSTTTVINLDAPVNLATGSYTLKVKLPDGTLGQSTVNIAVGDSYTSLTLANALPVVPITGAIWGLSSPTLSARTVRCIGRTMDTADSYVFTFVSHNPSKYQAIEDGLALTNYDFSILNMDAVDAVTNLVATEASFKPMVGAPTKTVVNVGWDQVVSPLQSSYMVKMVGSAYTYSIKDESQNSWTFNDVAPGTYTVTVNAVNQFGKIGPDTKTTVTVTGLDTVPPDDVSWIGFTVNGLNGVTLTWTPLTDYIDVYEIHEGADWATSTLIGYGKTNQLTGLQITNTKHTYWIKAKDTSGNYSVNATSLVVDLDSIGTPVVVTSFGNAQLIFNWNDVSSPLPIVAYDIVYGTDFATGTAVGSPARGPCITNIDWLGNRLFFMRARDCAGNTSGIAAIPVNVSIPPAPTSLAYSFADSDCVLTWVEVDGPLPVTQYEIRYGSSYPTSVFLARTSAKNFNTPATWPAGAATARTFWITQIDLNGNVGIPASIAVTINAPGAVSLGGTFLGAQYVLSWTPPTADLRIDKYIVKQGATWDTAVVLATINALTFTSPVNWGGNATFWVEAVDCSGNQGTPASTVLTVVLPSKPTGCSAVVNNTFAAAVSWNAATPGTLPVDHYVVTWTVGGVAKVYTTTALSMTTDINWVGNMVFTITAYDTAGNAGTSNTCTMNIIVPKAPVLSPATQSGPVFVLNWTEVQGSLPISSYEVRYGVDFATGTFVATLNAQTITVTGAWAGTRKYFVVAKDTAGNVGPSGSVSILIRSPIAPTVTDTVVDNNVELRWTDASQTMPIAAYNVYRAISGTAFASAQNVGTLLGQFTVVFESTKGFYDYWVTATDSAGNTGPSGKVTAYVNQPPDYQVQLDRDTDFDGLNYEFSVAGNPEGWTVSGATQSVAQGVDTLTSTGTTPLMMQAFPSITFYGCEYPRIVVKLRRLAGSGWAGVAQYVSTVHGASSSFQEVVAATIAIGQEAIIEFDMTSLTTGGTDWMSSQINSVNLKFGNTSSDVFQIDYIRFVTWTGSNVLLQDDNTLLLPVNMTEVYSGHFTSRSWASPQAQVTAGFPVYIQPTPTTAYYEQIIDYGAVLPGTQVQVTFTTNVVIGTIAGATTLSVKQHWADPWQDTVGQLNIYAINFRYIKVRVDYTAAAGDAVMEFTRCNVKLALKMRTAQGVVTTNGATDVQGNLVDYTGWVAGTSYPTGWVRNGLTTENKIANAVSPYSGASVNELCWIACNTDVGTGSDGGFTTPDITIDQSKAYMYACFFKTATDNGDTQLRAGNSGTVVTLAGGTASVPNFFTGDLPTNSAWYLIVGFVHESTYGTTDTLVSGIYDLTGAKVATGTEFKWISGITVANLLALQQNNTTDTAIDIQWMLRPVVRQCDLAGAPDMINYIINAAVKDGAFVPFTDNPIDVSTIMVTPQGTKPVIPIYDFVDVPYPKGMNVYTFDTTGAYVKATVSWTMTGTW